VAQEVLPDSRVVVATDDAEISAVAKMAGFEVFERGPALAEVGVNHVVAAVANSLQWAGEVMLVQPTVQPITVKLLQSFTAQCEDGPQKPSLAMGIEERHQIWSEGVRLTLPLQRQERAHWPVREMGIRWWPKADLIWHADTITVYSGNLVDIDTWADYEAALHILDAKERSTVTFVPLANSVDGRGHLYRCLTLAPLFGGHKVLFMPADKTEAWAIRLIHDHGWKTTVNPVKSNLVINDQLDMTAEQVFAQREWARVIVNLEDEGTGAAEADLSINALGHSGGDWAVIRPEFFVGEYDLMREPSGKVLVLLNTDPMGMLQSIVEALDPWFEVSYMVPSDVPLAVAMADADVLVTSGGRTVFEAAALGIPTVVIPQHKRESEHGHLGNGRNLISTLEHVREDVEQLMVNRQLRVRLSANGRIDGFGGQRIAQACEWLMNGYGPYISSGG
jgi:spore coat polysaccharide biosynthesis predicted glycosyltransferase SpsG